MTLEIVFWDVQHGSSTYIKTPNRKHLVQDLGVGSFSKGKTFSPLLHLKNSYGITRLDQVIITHPHKDHIEDIMNFDALNPKVLQRPKQFTNEEILEGVRTEDREIFKKYIEINERYSNPISSSEDPGLPENNGGVKIRTFSPKYCSKSNFNNHSIVTVVSYAESKVILAGDNEPPSWEELLNKKEFREAIGGADVLLAPHHGRESGFHSELFKYFKPKITVISDGKYTESSAVSRYGAVTDGWTVHKKDGSKEERKCLTTRMDGVIRVKIGYNNSKNPFIHVEID